MIEPTGRPSFASWAQARHAVAYLGASSRSWAESRMLLALLQTPTGEENGVLGVW